MTIQWQHDDADHRLIQQQQRPSYQYQQQQRRRRRRFTSVSFSWYCIIIMIISILNHSILIIRLNCIVTAASTANNNQNHNNHLNPYTVLGVRPDVDDIKIIRRKYRELCLKYHPDKNYNTSSLKQQKLYEQKFKQIQEAYALIGTKEAKKRYDTISKYTNNYPPNYYNGSNNNQYTTDNSNNYRSNNPYEDLLRRMFEEQQKRQQQQYTTSSSTPPIFRSAPFFFSGSSGSSMPSYYSSSSSPLNSFFPTSGSLSFKSIYLYKVNVSLNDLYNGKRRYVMKPRNALSNNNFVGNIWKRYTAAFRGNIGYILLYQSLLYSIPFWRISKIIAIVFVFYLFDRSIPSLPFNPLDNDPDNNNNDYCADLLPGYKGGTKFTFHVDENDNNNNHNNNNNNIVDVVFELCEERHKIYKRIGNNLYATIAITSEEAENGCTVYLQSLYDCDNEEKDMYNNNSDNNNDNNNMIPIKIPSGTKSGDQIIINGYGWPIRTKKGSSSTSSTQNKKFGDLIITVHITFDWKRWFQSANIFDVVNRINNNQHHVHGRSTKNNNDNNYQHNIHHPYGQQQQRRPQGTKKRR